MAYADFPDSFYHALIAVLADGPLAPYIGFQQLMCSYCWYGLFHWMLSLHPKMPSNPALYLVEIIHRRNYVISRQESCKSLGPHAGDMHIIFAVNFLAMSDIITPL